MADGTVQVAPDSTGKKIDTSEITVGTNTVERQRINLADPSAAAAIAAVKNGNPASSDYGLAVREANLGQQTMANSQAVTLASDQSAVKVDPEGTKATYCCVALMNPATTPTDVIILQGSASKKVRVRKVSVSGQAGSAGQSYVQIVKRTAANTGGTLSGALSVAKGDTADAAAAANMQYYTVNPTALGTGLAVAARYLGFGTGATTPADFWVERFGEHGAKAVVLKDNTEYLVVNLNGQSVANLAVTIEWTEE